MICRERSGFLFAHKCDRPPEAMCARCGKSVCAQHVRAVEDQRWCVSCERAEVQAQRGAPAPRGPKGGEDDLPWRRDPYDFRYHHRGYVYYDAKKTILALQLKLMGDALRVKGHSKVLSVLEHALGSRVTDDNGTPGDPSDDFERYAADNPLGDQLALGVYIALEVAVLAALLHGLDGPHTPVNLVGAPLVKDQVAGAFIRACKQPADHDGVRARGKGLDDIPGELDSSIRYDRDARSLDGGGAVLYG